jgi:hypothetical protein
MAPGRRPGPGGIDPDEAEGREVTRVQQPGPASRVAVRLPTLEVFAARHGNALAMSSRPLTQRELELAQPIFGLALRYEAIRVVVTPIANTPVTMGNFVRVAPTKPGANIKQMDDETLIHELTHVWQYQNRGMSYLSNSLCHQVVGLITTGKRNAAYRLRQADVWRAGELGRLGAEQQATLVQYWFAGRNFDKAKEDLAAPSFPVRDEPIVDKMLEELRRARPLQPSHIENEAAYGAGAASQRHADPFRTEPPPIPWLRIEF